MGLGDVIAYRWHADSETQHVGIFKSGFYGLANLVAVQVALGEFPAIPVFQYLFVWFDNFEQGVEPGCIDGL